eukprot:m.18830 g.18830  ORF g.18830 m.18830 type:complete len:276 (-) comp5020_c0_seq1:136-963(-)
MDSFAALSLATEKANDGLLKFKPYGRNEPLITSYMAWRIVFQVVLQSATFLSILYFGEDWFDTKLLPMPPPPMPMPPSTTPAPAQPLLPPSQFSIAHYTVLFNVFVLSQLTNQFCCRKLRGELNPFTGLGSHVIFMGVFFFSLIVQVLIVEFGGSAIETQRLNSSQWGWCILVGLLPLLWSTLFNLGYMLLSKRSPKVVPLSEETTVPEEPSEEAMALDASRQSLHNSMLRARSTKRTKPLWSVARDVLMEVEVVNAFRGDWKRRNTIVSCENVF